MAKSLTVSTVNLRGGRLEFSEASLVEEIYITWSAPEFGTISATVRLESAKAIGAWFLSCGQSGGEVEENVTSKIYESLLSDRKG